MVHLVSVTDREKGIGERRVVKPHLRKSLNFCPWNYLMVTRWIEWRGKFPGRVCRERERWSEREKPTVYFLFFFFPLVEWFWLGERWREEKRREEKREAERWGWESEMRFLGNVFDNDFLFPNSYYTLFFFSLFSPSSFTLSFPFPIS